MCPNSIVFTVNLEIDIQNRIAFSVTSESPQKGISSITFIKNTGLTAPTGTIEANQGLIIYDDPVDFLNLSHQVTGHKQFSITVTYDDSNNVCGYSVITIDLASVARSFQVVTEKVEELLSIMKNVDNALKAIEAHEERAPGSGRSAKLGSTYAVESLEEGLERASGE
jgi:hypothetical protein